MKIVLLYCQQCVSDKSGVAVASENVNGIEINPVMMVCSSKVQVPHIVRLLAEGADGVQIVACPAKACKFLVGSMKAEKRIEYVRGLMKAAKLNPECVGIVRKTNLSPQDLIKEATDRAMAVETCKKEGEVL